MASESSVNWSSVAPSITTGVGISAGGGLLGQVFGGWNARRQWKYQRRAMELQQKYALEQMKEQSRLQREQFDYENEYNSPVHVFERYRAAGINPSAVLGNSGASLSATMPMPSGPAGSSVSPGPGVSPAPDMSGSVANGALVSSQIDYNKAAAENQRSGAALQESKIPTEAALREFYAAGADKAANDANLAQLQANYQSLVNARAPEQIDAAISNMIAQTDKLVAARDVDQEQVKYLRECTAEMLVRADLERAMQTREQALSIKFGKETRLLSLQGDDLEKCIKSFDGKGLDIPVMVRDKSGVLRRATQRVNGYTARSIMMQYAAIKGMHDQAISYAVAGWSDANQMRVAVTDYVNAASNAVFSIGSLVRDVSIATPPVRTATPPYWNPYSGITPDQNF